MKIKNLLITVFFAVITNLSFAQKNEPIDHKATLETRNLYSNLQKLAAKGVMFGHQDDLAYGVEWKTSDGKRSDVYDVVKDYPAVFGWDLGKIEYNADKNLDGIPFDKIRAYIKQVYDMGGVNTISWHVDNPVTKGSAWDNTSAVSAVLPGGKEFETYQKWLKNVANFIKTLKGSDGKQIPILFRPYHELNGGWFWWGKDSATKEEYMELFKYTVNYLKDTVGLHNLIYMYNTNSFQTAEEYAERYPGDKYVDMVSFDNYQFSKPNPTQTDLKDSKEKFRKQIRNGLSILDSFAKAHHKIPAFAETGFETVADKDWWTSALLDVIKDFKISYVLVWRNHGWMEKEKKFHYFGPYSGHPSSPDFIRFYQAPNTLFMKDVAKQNLYK
ncbi:glycoside hydrolase family 26 protein [Pedobacter sp. Leaf194]|uniref:glycoside hydrolase family 26 protein n=1 Tax=Pedobacter sp. Leaf194 TaxID=1736297 RepID=UPI00070324C4|nr:glycosyl hydrolase [Pedobacter sp. Leaf194]KQS36791.1 beta-mannosidase [Pedobacter sp. Leaf194]